MKNRLAILFISDLNNYSKIKNNSNSLLSKLSILLFSRGFWLITFYRGRYKLAQKYCKKSGFFSTILKAINLINEFFIQIITKSQLHHDLYMEHKVILSHKGNMIVGAMRIGSGSILHENITIGKNNLAQGKGNMPDIGKNVWIGCRTIIYGKITIGDGATICEDTVLSRSIPANCVVKGNPAKVIIRNFNNKALRMSGNNLSSGFIAQQTTTQQT